jgi:geranyl-CoA carboxylase alpha subunit
MSFSKILVANRGEIACRVMRTARRLGYRTVAVFSDADAGALHASLADQAVHIGASPAAASYLNIEALLAAARASGADAVHPGYGFLSERADFALACLDAGLVFIGPPPAAIRAMGDKASAKRLMLAAGVPCAQGYLGEDQGDRRLAAEADKLGLPLLVKAVAGGGGRGMRLVRDLAELPAALAGARREALAAFGDGTLMLERLVDDGRHIEVQVFADAHGHALHLGERDCTAQRRRQKLIEEAPSPVVSPALREAMGRDAVAAALAVGYVGAGTVEFIVDPQLRHHFLEMNTRLQVEHPVTECITGFDLVEWQLRVAAGEPLWLKQDDIRFSGHAIEARLVAEDPYASWAPQTGRIAGWRPQDSAVRIDHGIQQGSEVSPYYDAMVAKFIAHGRDRDDAIRRLCAALEDVPLLGLQTNARFLRDLLRHPQFAQSTLTTTRLDEWMAAGAPILQRPTPPDAAWRLAAALRAGVSGGSGGSGRSNSGGNGGGRPASVSSFTLTLACDGVRRTQRAPVEGVELQGWADGHLRARIDGVSQRLRYHDDGTTLFLAWDGAVFAFVEPSPYPAATDTADPRSARAPVAGIVGQVLVAPGDVVVAGQPLLCVEAMKMEMWLNAAADGTVRAVHAQARQPVASGAVLVELEISE